MKFIAILVVIILWSVLKVLLSYILNFFSSHKFEIKLEKESKHFGKMEMDVISIKGRGLLPIEGGVGCDSLALCGVFDVTNGNKCPVMCFIPEMQRRGTYLFKNIIPLPYRKTVIKEWIEIGFIFPEICVFPKSKLRILEVYVIFINTKDKDFVPREHYSSRIEYYNRRKGYEEIHEDKKDLFKIEVEILAKLAMSDQNLDDKEGSFIKEKIINFIELYKKDDSESLKNDLNLILKKYYSNECKEVSCKDLCLNFSETATQGDKYDLIKSCIDLMSIDGIIDEREVNVINNISNYLDLDYKKVNDLKDFHILKGNKLNFSNPESILGVDPSWDCNKINNHLKDEFVKWNSRMQNCSDDKERNHIQYMLDLISEERLKYDLKKTG